MAARDSDEALCFSWAVGTSLAWSVPYKVEAPPVTWARLGTRWVARHTQAALRPRSTPFVEVTFPVSAPRVSRSMGLAPREWWGQSQGSVSCWPRLSPRCSQSLETQPAANFPSPRLAFELLRIINRYDVGFVCLLSLFPVEQT